MEERYIHYEKAVNQFVACTITGISSLTKKVSIYPFCFDYTCAPIGTKHKINGIISKNLVKREYVPKNIFVLFRFFCIYMISL